jgi:Ferredoxin-dependent bilin reductase
MDLEVPHPTYTTTGQPQGGFLRAVRTSSGATMIPTAATVRIPSATTKETTASPPAYFQRFWDAQLDVMRQRLRNLEEIPLSSMTSGKSKSTSHHRDMSVVENDSSVMITKAFRSDEYAYVRMTLLRGKHSHVFTSVWYPKSPELPILACDLLQFGGSGQQQQRHLCIVDYQPVIVPLATDEDVDADAATATGITKHAQEITSKVGSIRSEYPGLHGQMSKRFYPEGSPYFSRQMLLGRHVKAPATATPAGPPHDEPAVPSYESADEMVRDVYEAYQLYVDRHVSWTQQQHQQDDADMRQQQQQQQQVVGQQEREQVRIERHSQYDKFSSKYDPALPMLSHMYGSDFADKYVHDVLFPLSRRSR